MLGLVLILFIIERSTSEGKIRDARGFIDEDDLGEPFELRAPFFFEEVDEDRIRMLLLQKKEPFPDDTDLAVVTRRAESVWPLWPWPGGFFGRCIAFAQELEALSQKHRVWVCSSVPGSEPVLFRGEGDELGYHLTQSANGGGVFINRLLG